MVIPKNVSTKAQVSSEYLSQQKEKYGNVPWNQDCCVLVTGTKFPDSIGAHIASSLLSRGRPVKTYNEDLLTSNLESEELGYTALVMCHGATYLEWFEEAPLAELHNVLDVNLKATVNLVQAYVKQTKDLRERKKIIAIGSMAYNHPLNGSAVYCASKAGLAMLMKCLAWELAPKGYDVYCIHPSNVADTPMTRETIQGLIRYRNLSVAEAINYWNDSPIRDCILTKQEIAGLVSYLLSPNTGYLSGAQLELGGGQR
jgi:NAD(P)-dependent dehydrogenase (short-subunit alcohol dehydrogenase family)